MEGIGSVGSRQNLQQSESVLRDTVDLGARWMRALCGRTADGETTEGAMASIFLHYPAKCREQKKFIH